jgi:predicted nucleic acid-binding protein
MAKKTLIDAGPIVAALNPDDRFHRWAEDQFRRRDSFLTCEPVIAEVCARLAYYRRDQAKVLELIETGALAVDFSLTKSLNRVKSLMRKYGDQPMDLADACLVALSEAHGDCEVLTTDKNDFTIYRRFGRNVIPIVTP